MVMRQTWLGLLSMMVFVSTEGHIMDMAMAGPLGSLARQAMSSGKDKYRRPIYKPAAADLNEYEEYEYYTDDEDMGMVIKKWAPVVFGGVGYGIHVLRKHAFRKKATPAKPVPSPFVPAAMPAAATVTSSWRPPAAPAAVADAEIVEEDEAAEAAVDEDDEDDEVDEVDEDDEGPLEMLAHLVEGLEEGEEAEGDEEATDEE